MNTQYDSLERISEFIFVMYVLQLSDETIGTRRLSYALHDKRWMLPITP